MKYFSPIENIISLGFFKKILKDFYYFLFELLFYYGILIFKGKFDLICQARNTKNKDDYILFCQWSIIWYIQYVVLFNETAFNKGCKNATFALV